MFLDTGVLVGYANRDDPQHEAARDLLRAVVAGAHGDAFTSDYVLAEAFNFIRQRVKSETVARALDGDVFGHRDAPPVVRDVFRVHSTVFAAARQQYLEQWKAKLSFTDWTTIELVRRHGIRTVATFDAGFGAWVAVVP